jgi:arylsulfatase A-like enzyme
MRNNRIILKPVFKDMRKRIEKENPGISRNDLTRKMYQEYIKGYYRLVKSVDDQVARVLDYLKESGLEKDTLVIYTSDQGFSLGEHGFYNKQWMYENPLHQPLLVRFPGKISPKQVHQSMVNHIDLAPTLLDYADFLFPVISRDTRCVVFSKAKRKKCATNRTIIFTSMEPLCRK